MTSYTQPLQPVPSGIGNSGGGIDWPVQPLFFEDLGDVTGTNISTLMQAAAIQAVNQGRPLVAVPGRTYRGTFAAPIGLDLWLPDGATIKVPDGIIAPNIISATGAFAIHGAGVLDGNKANTTDPGTITAGCGIYCAGTAAGWGGVVQLPDGLTIINPWQVGAYFTTDVTALTDADNAPDAAVFADRLEVSGAGGIGVRFTGLAGVDARSLYVHGNGSHGARSYLCRAPRTPDVRAIGNTSGHGFTSLYCVDQRIDGLFVGNGTDGLVLGGDSSSATNAPGRRFKIGRVIARSNGLHGLCLDATISGSNLPVPVYGSVDSVLAELNGGDGVIVNSSQYVEFGQVDVNNNTAHGFDVASNAVSWRFVRALANGQKGIALQGSAGSPNWGNHDIGGYYLAGNAPDDTWTLGSVLAPSRFATVQAAALSAPPAALGRVYNAEKAAATVRSNTAALAADPDLQFASIDPGVYWFDAYLPYDASTTGDIAFGLNLPAGASISWGGDGPAGTIAAGSPTAILINRVEFTAAAGPAAGGANVGTGIYAMPRGVLLVTAAGAFALKWAQNTAEVSNCTLHALAAIRLTQIA